MQGVQEDDRFEVRFPHELDNLFEYENPTGVHTTVTSEPSMMNKSSNVIVKKDTIPQQNTFQIGINSFKPVNHQQLFPSATQRPPSPSSIVEDLKKDHVACQYSTIYDEEQKKLLDLQNEFELTIGMELLFSFFLI